MAFGPTNATARANSDMCSIELILNRRDGRNIQNMAEIIKIAVANKQNLEAAGFGHLLTTDTH